MAPPEPAFPRRHAHPYAKPAETMELPGTPPLELLDRASSCHRKSSSPLSTPSTTSSSMSNLNYLEEDLSVEERQERDTGAVVLQRNFRGYLARQRRAKLTSALGRPAELVISDVVNLEMLCDFRDVVSIYCNVRIMKKPFGPFMFQFTTAKSNNVNRPVWNDKFFVPMMSSKCEVVVTLIGVNTIGKLRFLGQAVAPLETGWERRQSNEISAPLSKWQFPVDETLLGLHRYVTGNVKCSVSPLTSRMTCMSGQFLVLPPNPPTRSSSFFQWTKKMMTPSTPAPMTPLPPETPSSTRKEMITQWGVLTDTHLHLFHHSSAHVLASLELSKLQLVQSSPRPRTKRSWLREPNQLYPLKVYCNETLYVLFVSTYAQQQQWAYRIDLHRRHLLVP
ncbi:hypothetical protein Poli38472_009029 [Pythium oligandrum]|uniref:C2 domain-containing protein n=1 Tax=Pythium oligandrum TaxID=41045 RepID=A0A8K1FMH2_PYTOL|nr:hypothetical protein Poli38472_009029 [Pythium oligandrum]|eukprot:TMW64862.1 hypothetical protein Poli38472_009029 [Pythium oligandrum]